MAKVSLRFACALLPRCSGRITPFWSNGYSGTR